MDTSNCVTKHVSNAFRQPSAKAAPSLFKFVFRSDTDTKRWSITLLEIEWEIIKRVH